MKEYIKVNVRDCVKDVTSKEIFIPTKAENFARIKARGGTTCEQVISWSVDSNDKEKTFHR